MSKRKDKRLDHRQLARRVLKIVDDTTTSEEFGRLHSSHRLRIQKLAEELRAESAKSDASPSKVQAMLHELKALLHELGLHVAAIQIVELFELA
jgi:hypothetical protein